MPEHSTHGPISIIAGRYALHAPIASGGMATVHIGRLLGAGGFSRIVAIKRLHAQFARHPDFLAMFLDEARLVARVRHPNVVQTLDVVATQGELFIVMEYVQGDSLSRALDRAAGTPMPPRIAAAIIAGALNGLHAAHVATNEIGEPLHVVHRDVSPQNILIGVDGVARIIDFGVAKALQRVQTTRQGQLKGKLPYMAPEQIGNREVDARTDVYAASVILWEALAGRRLFDADNDAGLISNIMNDVVVPPSRHGGALPAGFDEVTLRGLSRDPDQRFTSAREMAMALESLGVASSAEVASWLGHASRESLVARAALVASIEAPAAATSLGSARDMVDLILGNTGPRDNDARRNEPVTRVGNQDPDELFAQSAPTAIFPGSRPSRPLPSVQSTVAVVTQPPSMPPRATKTSPALALLMASMMMALAGAIVGWAVVRHRASSAIAPALASSPSAPVSATTGPATATVAMPIVAAATVASCPEGMVRVPGGKFFMGSDDDLPAERPAHQVTVSSFCIDRTEVTVEAYVACSDAGECKRAGTNNVWAGIRASDRAAFDPLCNARDPGGRAQHPVNCVDWDSAARFCKAKGKRLPTEAEWEFSARGSDGRRYPWGDEPPSAERLNACGAECETWGKQHRVAQPAMYAANDGWPTTAPVGSFPKGRSRFGVDDVAGNVWEWVADRYAPYGADDATDPTGPSEGEERVIRGGAFNGSDVSCVRPSFRFKNGRESRSYGVGFRCASSESQH